MSDKYKKAVIDYYGCDFADNYVKNTAKTDLAKFILTHLKKNSAILDLGCGTGNYSRLLLRINKSVFAIDISEKMLSKLKADKLICCCADICHLPLKKKYNFAICLSTIYYIKDYKYLLKEIYDSLCSDAKFIFNTHTKYSFGGLFFSWRYRKKVPQFFIKLSEFEKDLRQIGFKIVDVKRLDFIPRTNLPGLNQINKLLIKRLGSKTIDERICNIFKHLAFRHIYCVQK
jgi:SAM-dependent methyltransferase